MTKCGVSLECVDHDLIGRICSLSVGTKTASGFQIIKKGKATTVESEAFLKTATYQNMAEYHINLPLQTLREIDSDRDKLDKFLLSRLPKLKNPSIINTIVVNLMLLEGDKIAGKDIEYLWDMLHIGGSDLVVPPLLKMPGKFDAEYYQKFVKDFLELGRSYRDNTIVCAIPSQVAHGGVDELIRLYKDEGVGVYMMDFGGKKPFNPSSEMIMRKILRELPNLNGERWFLYAHDVKPCKQGADQLVAEDLMLSAAGFNAVGPRRTTPKKSKEFLEKLKAKGLSPLETTKVFSPDDYGYHKLSEPGVFDAFQQWLPTMRSLNQSVQVTPTMSDSQKRLFTSLAKAYTYSMQFPEAQTIDDRVKEDDLRDHLSSKGLPNEIIPKIDKIKRNLKK